jgi:hypothetical protein
MHYVTHRSRRMEKHMFHVTCRGTPFVETTLAHPGMKNSASMFHAPDVLECT